MNRSERTIRALLESAGIGVNGDNPWDLKVHDSIVYQEILASGRLGAGETYMENLWDCDALDDMFYRIIQSRLEGKFRLGLNVLWARLARCLWNVGKQSKAFEVGKHHYDISSDLYERMLDPTLCYSCGYWVNADNLEDAQQDKLTMICGKMNLKPGMRVLDIGCGWGSFARYAADNHGVEVVGLTVSQEQAEYARNICANSSVTIKMQDYRDEHELYDVVVSVGMFEHVGKKNYRSYMKVLNRCLKEDGLALLHTIGVNAPIAVPDPWVDKYIFPNGELPAMSELSSALEAYFIVEDWHNFGVDYAHTLLAWHRNISRHQEHVEQTMSPRFYRMWTYWLLSWAGVFRARQMQLWQVVLSKHGLPSGFERNASSSSRGN